MIIEDQALLNNMMQKVLSNDYDIVRTCTSAKEMMNLYKIHTPDLILTDVVTKDGANGIYYGKEVNRWDFRITIDKTRLNLPKRSKRRKDVDSNRILRKGRTKNERKNT